MSVKPQMIFYNTMKKYILYSVALLSIFSLVQCNSHSGIELPAPQASPTEIAPELRLNNPQAPGQTITKLEGTETTIDFELTGIVATSQDRVVAQPTPEVLTESVRGYNKFTGFSEYSLLSPKYYEILPVTIKAGETKGKVSITFHNLKELSPGEYLLPILLDLGNAQKAYHYVSFVKEGDYVAISDADPKPLPPAYPVSGNRTKPIKLVGYVETNNYDIRNYAQLVLTESRKPVYDIVVLFAANMNYNAETGKRYLFFNDKLQPIVQHPEVYIKPLTDRGIKVIIDILPNHQGVGYYNFQNYDEALEFACELKGWTDKLGIDGWDIDEEYADYGNLSSKPINSMSTIWFCKAMKEVMPDKLLTLYDYAINFSADETGKSAKDYIDYSWANYDAPGPSSIGLPNEKYGQISCEANDDYNKAVVDRYAERGLADGYGLYMTFNWNPKGWSDGDDISTMSKLTRLLYGEGCEFDGQYYRSWAEK